MKNFPPIIKTGRKIFNNVYYLRNLSAKFVTRSSALTSIFACSFDKPVLAITLLDLFSLSAALAFSSIFFAFDASILLLINLGATPATAPAPNPIPAPAIAFTKKIRL